MRSSAEPLQADTAGQGGEGTDHCRPATEHLASHDRPLRAIGLRLLSVMFISLVGLLAKLCGQAGISLTETVFWRQFLPVWLILGILGVRGEWYRLRTSRPLIHASRAMTGLLGIYLVVGAARLLPLAEATVFGFTAPLFAVILAATILREPTGWLRWCSVLAGLAGVAVIARPGHQPIPAIGIAVAIGGAFMVALTSLQVRDLARTEEPLTIVFWYCTFSAAAVLLPAAYLSRGYRLHELLLLCGAGICALCGQFCLTASLRHGRVSSVIVMDYAGLGWATLWGWLFFAQLPSSATWFGAPLVIGSGLIIVWSEQQRVKRAMG